MDVQRGLERHKRHHAAAAAGGVRGRENPTTARRARVTRCRRLHPVGFEAESRVRALLTLCRGREHLVDKEVVDARLPLALGRTVPASWVVTAKVLRIVILHCEEEFINPLPVLLPMTALRAMLLQKIRGEAVRVLQEDWSYIAAERRRTANLMLPIVTASPSSSC